MTVGDLISQSFKVDYNLNKVKMSAFPVSRRHQIKEGLSALLAAFVVWVQSQLLIPHYRGHVPFKQMSWDTNQILALIVELGMYEWCAKYII